MFEFNFTRRLTRRLTQPAQYDLGDRITRAMANHEIGLDEKKNYLPDEYYSSLITTKSIQETLPNASASLIDFILRGKAYKVFAITLLAISDPKGRLQAMKAFHQHNFTDDCLPIEKITVQDKCKVQLRSECSKTCKSRISNCPHDHRLDAFHHIPWGDTSFNAFYEGQWCFELQVFKKEKFQYVVEDKRILPFTKKHVQVKKGGNFSDVVQASILADHQDMLERVNHI